MTTTAPPPAPPDTAVPVRGGALAAGLAAGGAALAAVVIGFAAAGAGRGQPVEMYVLTNLVIGAGYLGPASVIARYRPRNVLVVLMAAGGFGHLLSGLGQAALPLATGAPAAVPALLGALMGIGWLFGLGPLFQLLLVLYPDGRLPSRRWRWFPWASGALLAVWVTAQLVAPDGELATGGLAPVDLALALAAVVALVGRYRRGDDAVRGQVLWLLLAVLVLVAVNVERAVTGLGPESGLFAFVCVPVAMAIGVVRHNLLDIRVVVARTVLYATLVSLLVAAYAVVVAAGARLVPVAGPGWTAAAGALVVAFALSPLRDRLRRMVFRTFYGRRGDPSVAAEIVGHGLGDAAGLGDVLGRARSALRLPELVLLGPDGSELARSSTGGGRTGRSRTGRAEIGLSSRGERLGTLLVTLRTGEFTLHRDDRAALGVLAGPLALLLRESALTEQLRDSRAGVVRARESERALLHRDLHDGLGPVLTNAAFRADAAANLLHRDPDGAADLLGDARAAVREALAEVRRVVYGLRPLPLEEYGLLGAVRERAAGGHALPVTVTATPDPLPELAPAVELAAYRIALEGMANAQRHSCGRQVLVRLGIEKGALVVIVHDDGTPPAGHSPGVGLRSVTERAEELGGTAEVVTGTTGWLLRARLPLDVAEDCATARPVAASSDEDRCAPP